MSSEVTAGAGRTLPEGTLRFISVKKIALVILLIAAVSGCNSLDTLKTVYDLSRPVERLVPRVLSTRPHDPTAFTEGLFLDSGHLYESTGRYGQSTMREVDPATGTVLQSVDLPATDFGEGIALVGSHLLQLTWREGHGYVYDKDSFALLSTFPYTDEGWGMCYDGEHLFTSDGSTQITERDASTLAPLASLNVSYDLQLVPQINELECVGDSIYANVWHTDYILRIDKRNGRVSALIDASGLITPEQRRALDAEAVLNGIAYDSDSDTFLITGKLWPWMFEVQFVAP